MCLPKGFYATPSRSICKVCLAVVRTAGFKTAGMRLLLAVSERRFMKMLPPRNNGGRERPQRQRLGNVALHCLLCSVSARLILCPHPSPPAARRRTQPNTRSGCPSKGAREGGSAFARSSPPTACTSGQGVFAPENPAFLSKNRFFAVSAPGNLQDSAVSPKAKLPWLKLEI